VPAAAVDLKPVLDAIAAISLAPLTSRRSSPSVAKGTGQLDKDLA